MSKQTTIIEINGIKMEVDLRHATIVHRELRVGSKVKLLAKSDYGGPTVHAGVIAGFEGFKDFPTIIVAYIENSYQGGLKFAYINAGSVAKWDLVPSQDEDMPLAKETVLATMDSNIEKAEAALLTARQQREFFLRHFNLYFEQVLPEAATVT